MTTLQGTTNKQFDWDLFDTTAYHRQYKDSMLWEDRCLGRATLNALLELEIPLKSLKNGIDACNGGVLRGPALIAPFIADEGVIDWTDYGKPQVEAAKKIIKAGKQGNLQEWAKHQTHMGECHSAWSGSGLRACQLGTAKQISVFDLPKDAYDIGITCFGPESLTSDPKEWELATLTFFRSIKKGGAAVMLYMVGSPGYDTAGEAYPATPISQEDALRLAHLELADIQMFFVAASHGARPKDDVFGYDGMGLVVGVRK